MREKGYREREEPGLIVGMCSGIVAEGMNDARAGEERMCTNLCLKR